MTTPLDTEPMMFSQSYDGFGPTAGAAVFTTWTFSMCKPSALSNQMPWSPAWKISKFLIVTFLYPLTFTAGPPVAVMRRFSITCPSDCAVTGPLAVNVHVAGDESAGGGPPSSGGGEVASIGEGGPASRG